ncbi:MAG TPA: hypothetical protein VK395_19705 [Gemmataceae bacterium]|nr:hypothetical protein [Gemmataceae bacterium]
MPLTDPDLWTDYLRETLQCYSESLLRDVTTRLLKPRNQWAAEELIERSLASIDNAAVVDRRLQDLDVASRSVLTLIARSRQPRWRLGNLLELLTALGHSQGPQPVLTLFEIGLLFPDLLGREVRQGADAAAKATAGQASLKTFEQWLGQAGGSGFVVFAHPNVMARALACELELPLLPCVEGLDGAVHEADGLEWPLRLAAMWQLLTESPLRKTQGGDFFKRDLDRLRTDPRLSAAPAESLADTPDGSLLAAELAQIEGLAQADQAELRVGTLPAWWDAGLPETLASLWAALPLLETWNPLDGWRTTETPGNPYPSAYLLALLLLARLPENGWADPDDVEVWICEKHPYWQGEELRPSRRRSWIPTFLLGLAYQLRLVQAAKNPAGEWLVRLSPMGRWVLALSEVPAPAPAFSQTLLVQPNLEIIAYRQGLTPALIGRLTRFAQWKNLGAACMLQLDAATVYRGLESGLTYEAILQLLESHGMRATPPAVTESLRTWANKRERISIYPSGTLFEFGNPEDMNEALARGLPGVRISDRLLVVAGESDIDFRHFRLTGTRDYGLPLEKCVEVDEDGVTLAVDVTRSDLLLETEIARFAEPIDGPSMSGRRRYRLTPDSLAASRQSGLGATDLEAWFLQRTGQSLSPAARLLLGGCQTPAPELRHQLVLHLASSELADGLCQWPGTRQYIRERLGETTLAIAPQDVDALRARLATLGVTVKW